MYGLSFLLQALLGATFTVRLFKQACSGTVIIVYYIYLLSYIRVIGAM